MYDRENDDNYGRPLSQNGEDLLSNGDNRCSKRRQPMVKTATFINEYVKYGAIDKSNGDIDPILPRHKSRTEHEAQHDKFK